MKKWLIFTLAWLWLPVNAHAAVYVVFLASSQQAPTVQDLEREAHTVFRAGLLASQPLAYGDDVASNFYDWLTSDTNNNFVSMFPSIQVARDDMRRLGPMTGLLIEVSPDNRAYNLRNTIDALRNVIPNPDHERATISRFLQTVASDVPAYAMVAALPVPSPYPVQPAIIRGENIRRAIVYMNDRLVRVVERNAQDGPFVENIIPPQTALGYPGFTQPPAPFRVGPIVSVAPGTDNVTFVEACGPSTSSRTSLSAGLDRHGLLEKTCKNPELIDFKEFDRRHRRHQPSIVPQQLLLL